MKTITELPAPPITALIQKWRERAKNSYSSSDQAYPTDKYTSKNDFTPKGAFSTHAHEN